MSNATAVAPERATKAPSRAKATPGAAPTKALIAPEATAIEGDEVLVAETLAQQLRAIYEAHWEDLGGYASGLVLMATKILGTIHNCSEEVDQGDVFHNAAAAVSGALAVVKAKQPTAPIVDKLEATFQTLQSADISYSLTQEPCEALADGIRAGQRQYRDRPAPPIRPMEEESEIKVSNALTRKQLLCVLEVAASNLATIDNILMQAQTESEAFALSGLIDVAQALTRHCGGMVDTAAGAAILGGHDRWNFGPNFADLGKASAT